MKHICHCTSVHKLDDVRIFIKECAALVAVGYKVSLVVPGATDATVNGVEIHGVPLTTSRWRRFYFTVNAVAEKALSLHADAYHLHDPELLRIAKRLKQSGAKVVYDAHEDLPKQLLAKTYLPIFIRKILSSFFEKYEKTIAKKISGIITATPLIADRFKKYNPSTVFVGNYPELTDMPMPVEWVFRKEEICYVGGIFRTRGAFEMIRAMEFISDAEFNLAGTFSPASMRDEVIQLPGWSKVKELGFLNRDGIRKILSQSKVGLVLLHPTQSYMEALPVKLFEYMAAGIPVVASDFPILSEIVKRHRCGILIDPLDVHAIATAINFLLQHPHEAEEMGRRGRQAVENEYSWDSQAKKLVGFYSQILALKN